MRNKLLKKNGHVPLTSPAQGGRILLALDYCQSSGPARSGAEARKMFMLCGLAGVAMGLYWIGAQIVDELLDDEAD